MDEFVQSKPIPPYLVTIALVPEEYKTTNLPTTESETPIVIYALPSDLQAIEYGGVLLLRSFIFYKKYFIIPYALPELKVIVYPDFEHVTEVGYYGSIAAG